MFILYAVLIGLLVGFLLGGRWQALGEIRFHWALLIALGFLAQVVLFTDQVAGIVGDAGPPLYVGTTLVVGAAVLRNIRLPGMPLILAGALSNMAAILANGGFMPATPEAYAALGKAEPTIYSNSAVLSDPALAPLVDRFALPTWLPLHNVFSLGDVLLGVGVAVLIVVTMRRSPRRTTFSSTAGAPTH